MVTRRLGIGGAVPLGFGERHEEVFPAYEIAGDLQIYHRDVGLRGLGQKEHPSACADIIFSETMRDVDVDIGFVCVRVERG